MAQKLVQSQSLQQVQTLSPQQVLQVRLLEMPMAELEERVKNELMDNGALEERLESGEQADGTDDGPADAATVGGEESGSEADGGSEEEGGGADEDDYRTAEERRAMDDYRTPDDVPDYLIPTDYSGARTAERITAMGATPSFRDMMEEQMNGCGLSEREKELMDYIIGSLDADGLLRKKTTALADEMEIYAGMKTTAEELEAVLKKLQTFDPPGIGARSLKECLLIQLQRPPLSGSRAGKLALTVVEDHFDDFVHKRWERISRRMKMGRGETERVRRVLARLNPRPGSAMDEAGGPGGQQIVPDFTVETDDDGEVSFSLCRGDVPELRVSPSFADIAERAATDTRAGREALQYTRRRIEMARGFIEALRQRRRTLTEVMRAITELQHDFFVGGDEASLRPMILKDVAQRTGLDISTVSRAVAGKYVETRFGTYPLKWFFSDAYVTPGGEEVATRRIQAALRELIGQEDRRHPLSDEELAERLNRMGLPVARRTVAKYRGQMGIPVARLRR